MPSNEEIDVAVPGSRDVALFTSLCQFIWVQGEPLPLIYEIGHPVYTKHGIDLPGLRCLEAVGLISLEAAGYVKTRLGKHTRLFYFGYRTKIQFPQEVNNQLDLGHVLLTDKGKALTRVCSAARNQEFYEYVIEKWSQRELVISSILIGH